MATFNGAVIASGGDGVWVPALAAFDNAATTIAFGAPASVGNNPTHLFLLIPNVTIEPGAPINSAALAFIAALTQASETVNAIIAAADTSSPSAPTSSAEGEGLTLTTAQEAWNNVLAQTSGDPVSTPDISAVIQELVDRGDWTSGSDILLVVRSNGSSVGTSRDFASFDHTTLAAPALAIDYTAAAGPQSITAAAIASGHQLFAATLAASATLNAATIPSGHQLHAAAFTASATVDAATIPSGHQLHTATLEPGTATLNAATIPSGNTLHAATVRAGSTISAATITSGHELHAATLTAGTATLSAVTIPSGHQLHAATVTAGPGRRRSAPPPSRRGMSCTRRHSRPASPSLAPTSPAALICIAPR